VRRRLERALAPFGFRRTKTTFWTRPRELVIEVVHLPLFTFAPAFRVHLGVPVLNDAFDAPALNGPCSHDGGYGDRRQYVFEYAASDGRSNAAATTCAGSSRTSPSPGSIGSRRRSAS
jgi:hypothetical protein